MDNELIVTQNLMVEVSKFEALFKEAKPLREPIMIVGPTGVGKSLFLHIFERLYCEFDKRNQEVVWADCSHFSGADPNIARSELFGHVRGSFSGALGDKEGLVKKADKGALILEEVGVLQEDVQAMLLTFVETGKFRKLGSDKEDEAEVWIVAATNNEDYLRNDLRYRFFPFYVRPLYERREDVLHYFASKYPDLIRKLRPWEILALLAYNWPGNVREIERIGKIFNVRASGIIKGEFLGSPLALYWQDKDPRSFNVFKPSELHRALEECGVDVKFLESLLNKHKVGLNSLSKRLPFKKFKKLKSQKDDKLGIIYVELNELFSDASMEGLDLYCHLFQQVRRSNANLLNPTENELHESELGKTPRSKKRYAKLRESINNYLTKTKKGKDEDITITNMTFEELQKYYFTELLALTAGNKTKAAERAGMARSTFYDHLKGLKIG